jgi:hypothetical protein
MAAEERCLHDLRRLREIVLGALRRAERRGTLHASGERWSIAQRLLHLVLACESTARRFEAVAPILPMPAPRASWAQAWRRTAAFSTYRLPAAGRIPAELWPDSSPSAEELESRAQNALERLTQLVSHLAHRPRRECWLEHRDLGALSFEEWVHFLLVHTLHHERWLLEPPAPRRSGP